MEPELREAGCREAVLPARPRWRASAKQTQLLLPDDVGRTQQPGDVGRHLQLVEQRPTLLDKHARLTRPDDHRPCHGQAFQVRDGVVSAGARPRAAERSRRKRC